MRVFLLILRLLPGRFLSRVTGWLALRRFPPALQGTINRGFARAFRVDMREADGSPGDYPSLSSFFVRRLIDGTRSWPVDPMSPGSPADGVLGPLGRLERGSAIQAKGITYRVSELLGNLEAQAFESGLFLTIYLSPRHYHRVHVPCRARLHTARAVSGRLLPVHPSVATIQEGLFTGNERLVMLMESSGASLAVVAIGACNVGSIGADFDPKWQCGQGLGVTNRRKRHVVARSYEPPIVLNRGDPLATFYLGSTVVVLVGGDQRAALHPELRVGSEVRLGMPILDGPLRARTPSVLG